ncbi:N-acetylmuramoyl-L-alanine amidase [Azotosporobacter soli]|uniref:N-acetylmuramoyl-L-alanine amidase family protein n=1 Tax=Azotosporobacter soli TaxID=3055040 RepID=UPI0031FEBC15
MLVRKGCFLLLCLLALSVPVAAAPAKQTPVPAKAATVAPLSNSQFSVASDADTGEQSLRLTLDAAAPLDTASRLSAPDLLTVDVRGATPGALKGATKLDGTLASTLTISAMPSGSRLEIRFPQPISELDYKVSALTAADGKPAQLLIEITKPSVADPIPYTAGLRGKVIALDPGHGGSDAGAHGNAGVQEKDVNLAVARKVEALLEKEGAIVCMTRQTDIDVYGPNASGAQELGARTRYASFNQADLFVSIHANWFGNPAVGGTGSYYYPRSYYSKLLAKHLQRGMAVADGLKDRGIYSANFYVLKHTDMPSCLVELAFLSNPQEEKLLDTPAFQDKLALGIVNGLKTFFVQASQLAK